MRRKLIPLLLVVLILALPSISALAAEEATPELFYVIDLADILSDSEEEILTNAARSISESYGVGVHIGIIDDMRSYGFDNIEACAETFYESFELGMGDAHTGILLLLSMADRDYDLDAFGEFAHYAFTDYGKTTISDVFLDKFRNDDWYGGFYDYLARCETMIRLARDGQPVDITPTEYVRGQFTYGGMALSAILSLIIAALICGALKSRNKSVRTAVDADRYVPYGAVDIRVRQDRFSHTTTSRVKIQSSERSGGGGGGGTTISSGGHSHSSGKF